ncbi:MAG: hypothetical protein PF480_12875 [Roseovarius sp.]|jgi:hypothetical protein|nr:hypothetical protein [Roseovarius sp.]
MPDIDTKEAPIDRKFTLSEAHSERVEHFATAAEAGRAFADADTQMRPRVIESSGNGARKIAATLVVLDKVQKSVPAIETWSADNRDREFWAAYGARQVEKKEEAQNRDDRKNAPEQKVQPDVSRSINMAPDGVAEPAAQLPPRSPDERFALPVSFQERFILTREANRQDMFRSYDETRPTISDRGDSLHTRNADRSTAMDMIELAAHRGWSSMKVKGPEDFRREMWIEATAQGIRVQGYRPNDKDRAEADRRAELIGERVIERTDQGRSTYGTRSQSRAQPQNPAKGASNVVPMIDYQKGIEGKITAIATAPYRDREGASSTPYLALELADGRTHKLWGVALPDMIDKHELKVGDKATIFDDGKKAVTVKTRDPKTGEERDVETFRREWGARDIERARAQENARVEPVQKRDEAVIETSHPDRLEERLNQKEAARDPELRGAASILAQLDAEMRTAGVPEKDRATVRDLASSELAKGIREGRQYEVQRLPNVSIAQQMAAKSLTSKDVSRIIGQAQVQKASGRDATEKGNAHPPMKILERSTQTERGQER